ncbi:MAG: hypothetical protein OEO21_08910 [Candidatus Krumholzibacteria bacterium]|nr:hypothetical protein [Candidatus Krumholzibacteria bacterium]
MIDENTLELMHLVIDGSASTPQREALQRRLQDDPEAKAHFESLQRVVRLIESVPEAAPPEHLFHRIVDAVPFGRARWARGAAPASGLSAWLRDAWRRPGLRFAGTFGLGLAVGVALISIAGRNWHVYNRLYRPLDISEVSGTMKTIQTADGFREIARLGVGAGSVSGVVRLHRSEEALLAEVDLKTSGEIDWVLSYGSDGVSFEGFRRLAGTPEGSAVESRDHQTRVHQSGDDRYFLFFSGGTEAVPPMTLRIYQADALVFEGAVGGEGGG